MILVCPVCVSSIHTCLLEARGQGLRGRAGQTLTWVVGNFTVGQLMVVITDILA